MSNFDLQLNEELEKLKKKKKQNTPQLKTFDSQLNEELEHLKKYGTNTGKDTGKYKDRQDDIAPVMTVGKLSGQETAQTPIDKKLESLWAVFGNEDFKQKSGYVSTKSEGFWDKLSSKYGMGYNDLQYEYINNLNGIRDEIDSRAATWGRSNGGKTTSSYDDKGLGHMTANEVAVYNYYYQTEGKDKAEEFLDALAETLSARKAGKTFEKMQGKTAREILYGIPAGVEQFRQGVKNLGNMVVGKDDYIPQTATQILTGKIREDLADDGFEVLGSSAGQMAFDALTTGTNMIPSIAVGAINPAAGAILMGGSAAGNTYQEALNEGLDKDGARLYATTVGTLEGTLQYALGGIGKLGGTSATISRAVSGIKNGALKFALEYGGKIASEGLEEGLQEVLDPIVKNAILGTDEEVNWEEVAYSALLGGVMGGVFGASEVKATHLNTSETAVVEKVFNDRVAEKEANGKKLTTKEKNELHDEVLRHMDRGYISIDTIEEVLGKDSRTEYDNLVKESEEYNELYNKEGGLSQRQQDRLAELMKKNEANPYETAVKNAKTNFSQGVFNMVKDSRLAESYRESDRYKQDFKGDIEQFKGARHMDAVRKTLENAEKAEINGKKINNSNQVHDFVDLAAKISGDTGKVFTFKGDEQITADFIEAQTKKIQELESIDPNKITQEQIQMRNELKEMLEKVKSGEVKVDGNIEGDEIVLNLNSPKPLNFITGHEVTHSLEQQKAYKSLKEAVFSYARGKGIDVDKEIATRKAIYQGITNADAEAELVSDLVGGYLFMDEDFVTHLAGSHRNVFQKVYDEIKYMVKLATAGSKAARDLERVKKTFEDAYRQSAEFSSEAREFSDADTKFSIRTKEPPKNTIEGYKVFVVKDGKLYPPMVANPEGEGTPVGVWLDADVGGLAYDADGNVQLNDRGRFKVKAGGKGTQGGSGELAFRPGWHLGEYPDASQFGRANSEKLVPNKDGKMVHPKELFPYNFVWARCEVAADNNYQLDAMSFGVNEKGNFERSQAGLPYIPEDGYYKYRTNANPDTAPWIISGSIKVVEILDDNQVAQICAEHGVTPQQRQAYTANTKEVWPDAKTMRAELKEAGVEIPKGAKAADLKLLYSQAFQNGEVKTEITGYKDEARPGSQIDLSMFGLQAGEVTPTSAEVLEQIRQTETTAATRKAETAELLKTLPGYAKRQINFADKNIINEFAMNNQDVEEYRRMAEESGHGYLVDDKIYSDTKYSISTADGEVYRGLLIDDGDYAYSDVIKNGLKKGETRETRDAFLDNASETGERIALIRSGVKGKFAAYATAKIGKPEWIPREEWENRRDDTRVPEGSKYDLKDGADGKWYYPLEDVNVLPDEVKPTSHSPKYGRFDTKYSLSKDTDGNNLTQEQRQLFKDTKTVDENGNLKVLYHGSRSEAFTEFDLWEGVWLTPDPRYAEIYAGQWHSWRDDFAPLEELESKVNGLEPDIYSDPDYRVYKMYANIKNPADIGELDVWLSDDKVRQLAQALGMRYTELKPMADSYMEEYAYMLTRSREFIELAKSKGFDGFKATEKGKETWCAFESPDQVKLTTNESPTENPDIRYSLTVDNEGNKLTQAQEKYFKNSKAVDDNGNLKVLYHGSPKDFNTFSLKYLGTNGTAEGYGFYFTDKKNIAEGYSRGYEGQQNGEPGRLFECYLDIKKPLSDTEVTMTRAQFKKFLTELNNQVDADGDPLDVLSNYGDVEWEGLNKVLNYAMEIEYDGSDSDVNLVHSIINGCGNMEVVFDVLRKTVGYDGIIVDEASWGGDQKIYIAFHPEQIKDINNLNPTSNPDIRYSLTPSNTEVVDGIAVSKSTAQIMKSPEYSKPKDYMTQYSVSTTPAWAKNYLAQNGDTKEAQEVVNYIQKFTDRMVQDDAIRGYVPMGEYKPSKFGPLRTNQEYIWTFDMDTSCPRTFQFLNYRDAIQRQAGRYLTYNESINLLELMRAYGQNIPCCYCYVENKRVLLSASYNNFFTFRNDVMNAATDEDAAKVMYGYNKKKNILPDASRKALERWRSDLSYNPSITEVWMATNTARNSVLNFLDGEMASGNINAETPETKLNSMVLDHFGIADKGATVEIEGFVKDWAYDTLANTPHIYNINNDTDVSVVDERALALNHEALAYSKSASSAKGVENYLPYTDQLKNVSEEDRKYILGMGGIRKHSSNDFRMDYVQDYFLFYADLAAGKWTGHTYTKSSDFAKIFACTGDRINMSIAFYEDADGTLRQNTAEGAVWDDVKDLRKVYKNVGSMAMVTSDNQLSFALNEDWIDMIIPFHASGLNKEVWKNLRMWNDYTSKQTERFYNSTTMKQKLKKAGVDIPKGAKAATVKALYEETFHTKKIYGKNGEVLKPHFFPGDTYVNGQLVPGHHNNAETYFRLCEEYGVHPRFYGIKVTDKNGNQIDVTEHPSYLKLIKETSRTDSEQEVIQFNFGNYDDYLKMTPFEYAMNRLQEEAKNGGFENLKDDSYGIVKEFIEEYLDKGRPLGYLTDRAKDTRERLLEMSREEAEKQYSLTYEGETFEPQGDYAIYGKDMMVREDVAPVGISETETTTGATVSETENVADVAKNATTTPVTPKEMQELFPDDLAPAQAELDNLIVQQEDLRGAMEAMVAIGDFDGADKLLPEYDELTTRINELQQSENERLGSLDDTAVPPEAEAPYPGEPNAVPNPFEDRDWYKVGNQKVKAYMYENPEVKPFFQNEALALMSELRDTTRGERFYNDQAYLTGGNEEAWTGVSRHTSKSIETLLDSWHMSYDDIEKGLNAIIEDNGAENIAAAKKIEFMLNDRLRKGYTDFYSKKFVPPNQDYINLLNEKQVNEYSKEAFDSFMASPEMTRNIETTLAGGEVQGQQTYFKNNATYDAEPTDNVAPTEASLGGKGVVAGQQTYISTESKLNNRQPQQGTDDVAPIYTVEGKKGVPNGQQAFMPDQAADEQITRKQLHQNIVNKVKSIFHSNGFDFDKVLKKAKNLSTFATVDNTPQRVMEKALGYKEGQILSDLTVNQVAQNETSGIKWLNSFTDRKSGLLAQISKQYHIKPGSKESAAAQMYAEGFYVDENNDIIQYGDAELAKDFPNAQVQRNIKGLARDPRIRQIYDQTLAAINASRKRNAYPEIPRLDNYFLHFRAMEDTFSRLGLPFNPNDIRAKDLPTDLNGVTADLKPGQPYFASAMHRTGKRTSFDLLGGLEKYLTSAKNQIYHIDDIQTLRAVRNYIADTYGQANGLEGLDALSEEEAQDRIEKVYNSHLSTFAKFLNEEANILAGKTALIDRGLEGIIGRRGITFLDTVNKQVGSNMVGFNISSSLTNFLPVAQTFAKTNKADFVKAFAQTAANKVGSIFGRTDSFTEDSPVVIRRKGADRFYRTLWQKAADPGYVLMGAVDDISTELIARTKYNELTRKGMDSQKAHIETDKWVSRLMGDRSLGQQPQLYNSRMLGLFTKFQLEVRNQLDSQFYDTIQETKASNEQIQDKLQRNAKTAAKVASTFVQLAVVQHLFGKAFESVAGYNPAFDIIEVIIKACGWDDEEDSEDTALDNIEQGFFALLEDLPYTSTLTGGRIPIESALPVEQFVTGKDQYGNEKSRWETLGEVAPYYLMPGGYGQFKKTKAGLEMFSDDHPVAGSYTDSGGLRFPVEDTFGNKVQAAVFGQYASENARYYFDNDLAPLSEKQVQEYVDTGMEIRDYWDYRQGLKGLDNLSEKADYINSLDVPVETKNILINNLTDRKTPIDMTDYDDFGSLEEFDFAVNNPEKYEIAKAVGGYENYKKFQKAMKDMKLEEKVDYVAGLNLTTAQKNILINGETDRKEPIDLTGYEDYGSFEEFEFAKENPESYAVAKAVGGYDSYKQYSSDLNDIEADKDRYGKSISGSRKKKVLAYINSLDADYYTKLILFKSEYTSYDDENVKIVEYLNSRKDISYAETVAILRKLGFLVDAKGNVTWD